MPSVGSTPTTTSPAQQQQQQQTGQMQYFTISAQQQPQQQQQQQTSATMMASQSSSMQHIKLQQQQSLPLRLQYQVTTTQPLAAGTFISQTAGIITSTTSLNNNNQNFNGRLSITSSNNNSNSYNIGGIGGGNADDDGDDDISPISSSESFSSADTNNTILNAIINQQNNRQQHQSRQSKQQQQQPQQQSSINNKIYANRINRNVTNTSSLPTSSRGRTTSSNVQNESRAYRTKYSQFMVVTPAVSIDRDFGRSTVRITTKKNRNFIASKNKILTDVKNPRENSNRDNVERNNRDHEEDENDNDVDDGHSDNDDNDPYFSNNNGNIYRTTMRQSSIDSGNSSDSPASFRSNYNPYLHTSRQHLLPKSTPSVFCVFSPSSWSLCTFLCAAIRCFGASGNSNNGSGHTSRSHYPSSFIRPLYQRNQSGNQTNGIKSNTSHRRLRSYSTASFTPETAFEHFSAPFKNRRKNRDPLNNVTYEL